MTADDLAQLSEQYRKNQSPAVQDAATSAVNATNRIFGRTPGVGAPGSTPATDQTNLNLAAAMDRADLGNRSGFDSTQYQQGTDAPAAAPVGIDINAINARRNQILNNIDPDNPGLYVSNQPGAHGQPSRHQELQHELGVLTSVVHEHSLDTAEQAHQDLIKQRSIDVAKQSANIFNGLQNIAPDGTPESAAAITKLIGANRLGFDSSPAVREEIARHAKIHDQALAALTGEGKLTPEDKNYWDNYGQSHNEAAQVGRKFGVDVQFDEQGFPSVEATTKYGQENGSLGGPADQTIPSTIINSYAKLQAQLAQHPIDAAAEAKSLIDAGKKGTENEPYSKSNEWAAQEKEAAILEKHFPGLKSVSSDEATAQRSATPPPNITSEAHAALKSGDKFWWNGKELTKK